MHTATAKIMHIDPFDHARTRIDERMVEARGIEPLTPSLQS